MCFPVRSSRRCAAPFHCFRLELYMGTAGPRDLSLHGLKLLTSGQKACTAQTGVELYTMQCNAMQIICDVDTLSRITNTRYDFIACFKQTPVLIRGTGIQMFLLQN